MRALTRKLKSQRGVSILYAMLLFLVCAFVAAATLTAAYHSAARSTLARKEQQAYLAVSAAAELIKGEVEGKRIGMEHTVWTEEITDAETGEAHTVTHKNTSVSTEYDGSLSEIGKRVFQLFHNEKMDGVSPSSREYALSFALSGYEALENVAGTLTVDESYGVTIFLWNKDSKGNALRILSSVSTERSGDITTVIWQKADVTPTTAP